MKKNKTLSFFKTTLLVLMASSFSISNSYGVDKLIKKESLDSTRLTFIHRVPQVTWNRDIKKAHIDIRLAIDKEHLEKPYSSFLFFRFCKKPDDMWFYGSAVWKKYKEGEAPNPYGERDISPLLSSGASNIEISPLLNMDTGNPIDISSMVNRLNSNCGELLAGYGVGTTNQEAYDEMLSQKRFNVVFDTELGPRNHKVYHLELKSISTYNSPPFVGTHICSRIRCL